MFGSCQIVQLLIGIKFVLLEALVALVVLEIDWVDGNTGSMGSFLDSHLEHVPGVGEFVLLLGHGVEMMVSDDILLILFNFSSFF